MTTEADTCREFVTPRLMKTGWGAPPRVTGEQRSFANGHVIVAGGKVDMRSHEAEVMRLLGEIDALVTEVPA
nr:hypothetical protein [Pseudoduganella albidiflava]